MSKIELNITTDKSIEAADLKALDSYRFWEELVHNYNGLIAAVSACEYIDGSEWAEFENATSLEGKISVVREALEKAKTGLIEATDRLKTAEANIFPVGFQFRSARGWRFRVIEMLSNAGSPCPGYRLVEVSLPDGSFSSWEAMAIDNIAGHISDCKRAAA
jgi:hypothetical protein